MQGRAGVRDGGGGVGGGVNFKIKTQISKPQVKSRKWGAGEVEWGNYRVNTYPV
jgi:hypothetical protein